MFLSFVTGGALKIIAGLVSGYVRLRREERLLIINTDIEKMKVLYGGTDTPDKYRDWTRRFLAVLISSTLCGILVYLMVVKPDQVFKIAVGKQTSWIVDFIFGSVDKGVLTLSAGALLWEFVNFVALICGFYFTKILQEK
jgi:uncharacterized membrane protein YjjP (DUF1212 family)